MTFYRLYRLYRLYRSWGYSPMLALKTAWKRIYHA